MRLLFGIISQWNANGAEAIKCTAIEKSLDLLKRSQAPLQIDHTMGIYIEETYASFYMRTYGVQLKNIYK